MSTKREIIGALFFVCFGLFLGWQSFKYRIWGENGPRAGFFPLALAIIIVVLSSIIIVKSLIDRSDVIKSNARKEEEIRMAKETGVVNYSKVAYYVILAVLFALLLTSVGFLITTSAYLLIMLKLVEKMNWKRSILWTSVSITVSYLLFVRALEVQLPWGIIPMP
jgi:Na+-transporting methylmalonyl-CoA/oxaloacetate decarboxylase beta subunit